MWFDVFYTLDLADFPIFHHIRFLQVKHQALYIKLFISSVKLDNKKDILSVSNTSNNVLAVSNTSNDILSESNTYYKCCSSSSIPTSTKWLLGATEVLVYYVYHIYGGLFFYFFWGKKPQILHVLVHLVQQNINDLSYYNIKEILVNFHNWLFLLVFFLSGYVHGLRRECPNN